MKKLICIILTAVLLLLCACNVVAPPVESGSESSNDSKEQSSESQVQSAIESENKYENFEQGKTSIALARQVKPLMTVLKVCEVLQSRTNATSTIGNHSFELIEGGSFTFYYDDADNLIDDMSGKEDEAVVTKAEITHEDGSTEVLFDISSEKGLKYDSIIFESGPYIAVENVYKIKSAMTKNGVDGIAGFSPSFYEWSETQKFTIYPMVDRRDLFVIFDIDDGGVYYAVRAEIISSIENGEVIFNVN